MKNFGLIAALSPVLFVGLLFLPAVRCPVAAQGPAAAPTLLLAVPPNETFSAQFSVPASFAADAWVGIVPVSVPHGNGGEVAPYSLGRMQLSGSTAGLLNFTSPVSAGLYDLRMYDSDSGKEVASITFAVLKAPPQAARLWLDKLTFSPGTEMQVHFSAPPGLPDNAWVGLILSDVPHGSVERNDDHDIDYQYLNGQTTGVLVFQAPGQPGSYDFRMNDTSGEGTEIASVTFTVSAPTPGESKVWLDKTTFAPGEEIQVHFSTPATYPKEAWMGIIPSDVPHGSAFENDQFDLDYEYLDGQTAGVLTFEAPEEPGTYDFRLHDALDGSEVASVTFTVSG